MDQYVLKGKWTQAKSGVRKQWGKLTDDDVEKYKVIINNWLAKYRRNMV